MEEDEADEINFDLEHFKLQTSKDEDDGEHKQFKINEIDDENNHLVNGLENKLSTLDDSSRTITDIKTESNLEQLENNSRHRKKKNSESKDERGEKKHKDDDILTAAVRKVEEKLKSRELQKLTVVTIEVADLSSAHRFTKNLPWLKASYGSSYSWVADYRDGGLGEKATWRDLMWSFNLERNIADRSDLVITVCSQNLIIGRYVLNHEEFSHIPDTKSGFFEVSGFIVNGSGVSGKIKMICQRGSGDRPSVPVKEVMSASSEFDSEVPMKPNSDVLTNDFHSIGRELFVKIISIAIIDMKAVHLLEANSPVITIECGTWAGISDVVRGAGVACRWNSLNWKITLRKDEPILATVNSNAKLIGKVPISLEEVDSASVKSNGMKEVVKYINNGKEISGKIKFNFLVKESSLPLIAATSNAATLSASANPSISFSNHSSVRLDDPSTSPPVPPIVIQHENHSPSDDVLHFESEPIIDDLKSTSYSDRYSYSNNNNNNNLPLLSSSLPSQQISVAPKASSPSSVPKMSVPFSIRVSSLTVLDTVNVHLLTQNVLSVNVACGQWGSATEASVNAGPFAHYVNLNWNIVVTEKSHFRVSVWSRGVAVGTASLTADELLDMPTDFEGNTEIYAKIMNAKRDITGKVKLTCRYAPHNVQKSKPMSLFPATPLLNTTTTSLSVPADNNNISSPISRSIASGMIDRDNLLDMDLSSRMMDEELMSSLSLPVIATVRSICVFDLPNVHLVRRNIPSVRFSCDRKSAVTDPKTSSGNNSTTEWKHLDWQMKVREDSTITATVSSNQIIIGKVNITPKSLLTIPLSSDKSIEVNLQLDNNGNAAGKIQIVLSLQSLDSEDITGDLQNTSSPYEDLRDTNIGTDASLIFDPQLLSSHSKSSQMGLYFRVTIAEIDVVDLKHVHSFTKNMPYVSAACGKWNEATSV